MRLLLLVSQEYALSQDASEVLRITNPTLTEITAAHGETTLKWHPDKNPDDPKAATEKFNKLKAAYDLLTEK